jgi:hypothetical protein
LATTVQPAASAGATLRVIMAIGKFQGVIAAHTPIGCFITITRRSGIQLGMTSPYVRLPSSANHSMNEAPYTTSPRASASGLPCSLVISRARSSACARIRSYHLRSTAARSLAVFARQPGNARPAASIARRVSATPMSATCTRVAPVAGFVTGNIRPLSAAAHWPSMKP